MVTEMSFVIEKPQRLKSLSGWKNSHRLPDSYSQTTVAFAVGCAADELKTDLDRVYDQLRDAFGLTRRQLEASLPDDGTGTIVTPYFSYSVTITLNPNELDEVIWTRTVDAIRVPQQIVSEAFANVFDDVFDTLKFSLPTKVDVEDFIDAAEAAEIPGLKIKYDREATYCELQLQEAVGTVTIKPQSLSIVHDRPQATQQLLKSFDIVRKLFQKHDVPLIFFAAPVKELPPARPKS